MISNPSSNVVCTSLFDSTESEKTPRILTTHTALSSISKLTTMTISPFKILTLSKLPPPSSTPTPMLHEYILMFLSATDGPFVILRAEHTPQSLENMQLILASLRQLIVNKQCALMKAPSNDSACHQLHHPCGFFEWPFSDLLNHQHLASLRKRLHYVDQLLHVATIILKHQTNSDHFLMHGISEEAIERFFRETARTLSIHSQYVELCSELLINSIGSRQLLHNVEEHKFDRLVDWMSQLQHRIRQSPLGNSPTLIRPTPRKQTTQSDRNVPH